MRNQVMSLELLRLALPTAPVLAPWDDPVLVEGDCFEAFVPVPDVMGGRHPGGADTTARPKDGRAEVRDAVEQLLARYGSFPASQLSREVTSVGERTVRRYLAKMVEDAMSALRTRRPWMSPAFRREKNCGALR